MPDLGKAYVQIIPSAKGIEGKISKELSGEADSAGKSFGGKMMGAISGIVAAAGIGKAISASITEGAALQQSLGGIETLFKDSADKVKENAANAYKTAGMSANQYMEMTTGFAASLLGSLGNDTNKAADMADMAMTDMSDNANKMGTSMELIQNAYQGFAKQNYTMLDNLKLGYGGTQEEMKRLLADAEKITGVKYDISNLADVYSAIHVIQGELGITGTTAKEAASTFSGSLAAMQSAFKNVIGTLSLGQDITGPLMALQETVHTFLVGNLIPMIGNVLGSLPELLNGTLSAAVRGLNLVADNADQLVEQGVQLVTSLVTGIITNIPYLVEAAGKLLVAFGKAIFSFDWAGTANGMITNLRSNLDQAAGEILGTDGNIIASISNAITVNLPKVLNKGVEIVTNIVNGILRNLPKLITSAGNLVTQFVNKIYQLLPNVLNAGVKLILNIVNGIINNLPQIVSAAVSTASKFIATIGQNLPKVMQSGIEIIGKLAAGLIQAIPNLIRTIPQIINSIKNAFLNTNWLSIGRNIISGIANGLRNAGSQLWNAVKGVLGSFKDQVLSFFGIHSPSRWGIFVGEMITKGFANGIAGNLSPIQSAVGAMERIVTSPFNSEITMQSRNTGINTDIAELLKIIIELLEIIAQKDPEIKLMLRERELTRALKDLGVQFA